MEEEFSWLDCKEEEFTSVDPVDTSLIPLL